MFCPEVKNSSEDLATEIGKRAGERNFTLRELVQALGHFKCE
ncbi:MAG: hypothetical protein RLZZ142_610 [Verrucomicrobiota bacterium]|jgi:hypothetical protein